ncbi:MAG: class I SAM-dependent methyltransferase [Ilumatobacteraceae bacterium]|nr:class I SAM-dependent methyltransferase [Ilumatobacteraceae bacterium]MBP7890377.1 class I SAM-dependent methyltransferase [Ilumatobacteraceae bacterium]MBP8209801.1 class I SAM-dependent methyltransferase [Ilumatobacteraceae bacterium]MBP9052123.1 class I SAM-dependent methyltransferase [Ilumatobacteraceae bacterium]HQY14232.1 class I SAM-dependent methyltransferase [Ilumatobacteraceae bacterium]
MEPIDPNPTDVADWARINMANWDSRVPHHEQGYALHEHTDDPNHLSRVVQFDLPRLGEIAGLRGVHLQCHIGTDTVSLARLGAQMTGLDFSAPALEVAARLAAECELQVEYVESDVYSALDQLPAGEFDFVYTGIGALCWLPSVVRWAQVVSALLKPGGFLFIREGHPMLWSLCDPRPDGLVTIEYPYFETAGTVFVEEQSYVEHDGVLESPTIVSFNHSLSEVFNALWSAGLTVTLFEEHQSVPWNPLAGEMVEFEPNEFRLREMPERLAATYTLRAVKN